jgi:hypothetical protein
MTPEEIDVLLKFGAGFGTGTVVAASIAFFFVKYFLSPYLAEKGKNLATREDIAAITDKVESVRSQYAVIVEELKVRHQLRLAALDRRLQVHQEAFTLWRELMAATHTDTVGSVVVKCQEWWEKNCVYLEPPVRESFVSAYSAAHSHNALVSGRAEAKVISENWTQITVFPNLLFAAVQLPALTELEAKSLGVGSEPKQADS